MEVIYVKVQDQESIHADLLLRIWPTSVFQTAISQIHEQLRFNNLYTTGFQLVYYDPGSRRQTLISNEVSFQHAAQVLRAARIQDRFIKMHFPVCNQLRKTEMMAAKIKFLEERVNKLEAENERLTMAMTMTMPMPMRKENEQATPNVPTKRERE